MKLSVVDIAEPDNRTLKQLLDASMHQGFLLIDGHDFTQCESTELFSICEGFFEKTPQIEKIKYAIDQSNFGYSGFNKEHLNPRDNVDYKEAFNFSQIDFEKGIVNQTPNYELNGFDSPNPLPPFFGDHMEFLQKFIVKLHAQAKHIIKLIGMAMDIDDINFFLKRFDPSKPSPSTFRMLHYPLLRSDFSCGTDSHIRAGAHTDYGALTLLFQREGEQGLQIQLDGQNWTDVEFVPTKHRGMAPPLIINFGDMMSYWTNGVLKSTLHRVRFEPGETRNSDRYSIVFFFEPTITTRLNPVPCKLVTDQGLSKVVGNPMSSLEYLNQKLNQTYDYS